MLFWNRPDVLAGFSSEQVDWNGVRAVREKRHLRLKRPCHAAQVEALTRLPTVDQLAGPISHDLAHESVIIGSEGDCSGEQHALLDQAIFTLHPWRKGPFRLFGHEIDAEWRSNLKWNRVLPAVGQLGGRKILDVGCGNGYYMFRAAAQHPDVVIGLDPSIPFWLQFELMQRFLTNETLQYELLGVENLDLFDQAFDIGLCMGIVYHHRNPLQILNRLLKTLKVGGMAIIESQTIPGDGSFALFPADRYAKARNVYFIPTKDCLVHWVRRAGFKNVELIDHTRVTTLEQRSTHWMGFESLSDFLNPHDQNLTVEGHPAPFRTIVRGERQFL